MKATASSNLSKQNVEQIRAAEKRLSAAKALAKRMKLELKRAKKAAKQAKKRFKAAKKEYKTILKSLQKNKTRAGGGRASGNRANRKRPQTRSTPPVPKSLMPKRKKASGLHR